MNDVVSWVALPGGSGPVLHGVPAGPEHLTLLHGWFAEPHVAEWWDLAGPIAALQAHLERLREAGGQPWVVVEDDVPFAYVETTSLLDEDLGSTLAVSGFEVGEHDLGWRVLVGRPDRLGQPVSRLVARGALAAAFMSSTVERIWCAPDVGNQRMLRYCEAVGFEHHGEVTLPDRRAAVLSCSAAGFRERWPDDLASVRRADGS